MGRAAGVAIAVLSIGFVEMKISESFDFFKRESCLLHGRYIDDVFFVFETSIGGNAPDWANFVAKLYNRELKIPLTVEAIVESTNGSDLKSIDVLDFKVTRSGDRFVISPFDKPTNLHLFIPAKSNHPGHVGTAWIRAYLQRLARNSSDFEVFSNAAVFFFDNLRARGYKSKFLFDTFGNFNYSVERRAIFVKFEQSVRTYLQMIQPIIKSPTSRFFVPIPFGRGTNAVKWTRLLNKSRDDHSDELQYLTSNYPKFGTAWTTLPSLATIVVSTLQSHLDGQLNPNPNS